MAPDQPFQLRNQVSVPAAGEIGLDPLLHRRQPKLVEPGHLRLRERELGHIRQRWTPPQPERPTQHLPGRLRLPLFELTASLVDRPREAILIDGHLRQLQRVTGPNRSDYPPTHRLAQLGHVDLDRVRRRPRRVSPYSADQRIPRDDAARLQREQRQYSPLLRSTKGQHAPFIGHRLYRPQDPNLHRNPQVQQHRPADPRERSLIQSYWTPRATFGNRRQWRGH